MTAPEQVDGWPDESHGPHHPNCRLQSAPRAVACLCLPLPRRYRPATSGPAPGRELTTKGDLGLPDPGREGL